MPDPDMSAAAKRSDGILPAGDKALAALAKTYVDRPGTMFSLKDVEAILAVVLRIADSKRETFRGRIQQLQRLGLPWGTNAGRGIKADYSIRQIAEILVYFDLLDASVPPSTLTATFKDTPLYESDIGWNLIHAVAFADQPPLSLIVFPNALAYLRTSGEIPSTDKPHRIIGISGTPTIFPDGHARPMIEILLSDRLRELYRAAVRHIGLITPLEPEL